MPISTMVHHEDIVCTINKYTADLFFSLPTIKEYLLPMILEDSQKGMSCEQLRIKWGLTERKLRRVTGKK